MTIKPIKTERDYQNALKQIEKLWDAKPNTSKGDRLEILVTLVEAYEQKHYKIRPCLKRTSYHFHQYLLPNFFSSRQASASLEKKARTSRNFSSASLPLPILAKAIPRERRQSLFFLLSLTAWP